MASNAPETTIPIREKEDEEPKKASTEQEINPWDVQAGHDAQGNALAFDYVAISKYAPLSPRS